MDLRGVGFRLVLPALLIAAAAGSGYFVYDLIDQNNKEHLKNEAVFQRKFAKLQQLEETLNRKSAALDKKAVELQRQAEDQRKTDSLIQQKIQALKQQETAVAKTRPVPKTGTAKSVEPVKRAKRAGTLQRPASEPPQLGLPLSCELQKDCWLVNFIDLDTSDAVRDPNCTAFSYNGHKGTDFAIRDFKVMQEGVPVVASAPGTIIGTRDGMDDVGLANGKAAIAGRECGNTTAIHHGGGWVTQYCHMRKGSVSVKKGQQVKRGDVLGLVGFSGQTQFPHVHISVRYKNRPIDPFTGTSPGDACGKRDYSLWTEDIASRFGETPSAIFSAGFAAKRPVVKSVRDGLYQDEVLSRSAPVLLLWADLYWVQKGDVLQMHIIGPDGETVEEYENVIEKTQARALFYHGIKRKPLFWPEGEYRGEFKLLRPNGGKTSEAMSAVRTVTLK